jgi:hypothetical protein
MPVKTGIQEKRGSETGFIARYRLYPNIQSLFSVVLSCQGL